MNTPLSLASHVAFVARSFANPPKPPLMDPDIDLEIAALEIDVRSGQSHIDVVFDAAPPNSRKSLIRYSDGDLKSIELSYFRFDGTGDRDNRFSAHMSALSEVLGRPSILDSTSKQTSLIWSYCDTVITLDLPLVTVGEAELSIRPESMRYARPGENAALPAGDNDNTPQSDQLSTKAGG